MSAENAMSIHATIGVLTTIHKIKKKKKNGSLIFIFNFLDRYDYDDVIWPNENEKGNITVLSSGIFQPQ